MTRFPLATLRSAVHAESNAALARMLGVGNRSVTRWQHDGLGVDTADVLAVRLGRHPAEVWPDWYETSVA